MTWDIGVVVSRLIRIQKASGSIPEYSTFWSPKFYNEIKVIQGNL